MKQLTDEVFSELQSFLQGRRKWRYEGDVRHEETTAPRVTKLIAALDTAQPVQVNAMLVEALDGVKSRCKSGYVGTDGQYLKVVEAALTAAKQAQPEKPDECKNECPPMQICDYCQGVGGLDKQAQPEPVEQPIEALQKLGARLAALLDEDQWVECEALLIQAGAHQ